MMVEIPEGEGSETLCYIGSEHDAMLDLDLMVPSPSVLALNHPAAVASAFPSSSGVWPTASTHFDRWVQRLRPHFQSSWEKWGISKLVEICLDLPNLDINLINGFCLF